mmetsp:Transcript_14803/g.23051  ORF Transcript_14803/g.23051 Transcript_14803/m.23051 type:complete len:175 (-) Transcript_14803:9-533(-)
MCAAPGGKACFIAQKMENTGTLIASDIDAERLKMVAENCERMGIECLETVESSDLLSQEKFAATFDKVLIDVPCSNSGVMRRRIDVRWRLSKEEIAKLHETQFQILQNAANLVRVGGVIVYSTCSIDEQENHHVLRRFLKRCGENFEMRKERQLTPFEDKTDGAYIAMIEKTAE